MGFPDNRINIIIKINPSKKLIIVEIVLSYIIYDSVDGGTDKLGIPHLIRYPLRIKKKPIKNSINPRKMGFLI
ncbi:MAG: hypothetical protein ACFFG0_39265 [Candidatus Thorarchaeota archaeon]